MTARLTDWQIRTMRRAAADGAGATELGAYYGISRQHVSRLVRGFHRAGAGGPILPPGTPGVTPPMAACMVLEIRESVHAGERPMAVAERLGIHKSLVTNIVRGKRHASVGGPLTLKDHRTDKGGRPLALSLEQRAEVADLLRRGERVKDLAEKFGVSMPLITKIRKEHRIAPIRGQGRCRKGHLLDFHNAYVDPDGKHRCKACRNKRQRDYRRVTTEQLEMH